jgi:glycosyltransferase involved in cell wall biosynthesis
LANQPFDVLHAFDHRPAVSIPSLLYRGRSRVPLVVDWADLWGVEGIAGRRSTALRHTLGRLDTWGERRFHQTADLVTPINAELARRTLDLGVPADRVVVILPGAPVDLIQPQVKQNARRALGLDSAAHVLVYIGYAPYDQDLVLDAFRQLADQDSLAQLITAGGPFVGGDKNTLPARLAARHRHLGEVPYNRLETLLGAGDLMLLPFRDTPVNRGRYPNKLGDYLAAGRPVLTNPTGELGRLVDQEGIGKLAAESGAAMAAGARELLQDPGQLEELGRRARLLAERRWGWVHRAATAEAAYLRLMG